MQAGEAVFARQARITVIGTGMTLASCLHAAARAALMTVDPDDKAASVRALRVAWEGGAVRAIGVDPAEPVPEPGRPKQPLLVAPSQLLRRRLNSAEGRAALIHAVAHIEFNAINLALDAVYRFRGMPGAFYADWLRVAEDEARHFDMLRERLRDIGYAYGDFPAHDGLWSACRETDHDVLVRMALVPRVLEARGLDVTPGMMSRLRSAGDQRTADILDVILREEEAHVRIGTAWFRHCCESRGVMPGSTFAELVDRYMAGRIRGPFNLAARRAAGFSEDELAMLEARDQSGGNR